MSRTKPPLPPGTADVQSQRLSEVGNGVSDAVLIIDDEHRVLWGNQAAQHVFQGGPGGVTGRCCWEVVLGRRRPCDRAAEECPVDTVRVSGVPESCQKVLRDPSGNATPCVLTVRPVQGPHGEIVEYVMTRREARDREDVWRIVQEQSDDLALVHTLTEMVNRGSSREDLLSHLSSTLRKILQANYATIYLLDAKRERLELLQAGVPNKVQAAIERIIQAPLPRVSIALERAPLNMAAMHRDGPTLVPNREGLLALMAENTDNSLIRKVLSPILRVIGMHCGVLVPLRLEGQPTGLLAVGRTTQLSDKELKRLVSLTDQVAGIINRQHLQAERSRLTRRQALLLGAVAEGILGLDNDGDVVFANSAASSLLGASSGQLQGRSVHQLCGARPKGQQRCDKASCDIMTVLESRRASYDFDGQMCRVDGSRFPARYSAVPLDEPEVGVVVTFRDVSERLRLQELERQGTVRLRRAFAGTVAALSRLAEMRDPYTAGHERRVAALARAIAQRMDLDEERVDQLRLAATIHDIGKHAIPVEILTKPGRLSPQEMELIRTHAVIGWEILTEADFPGEIATMVRQHHERLDGSGYPDGITGDAIILEARILAVADVVEAMASHRPYRASKGLEEALMEIQRYRNTHYDRQVVSACVRAFRSGGFSWE